jgi:hypothetical protein
MIRRASAATLAVSDSMKYEPPHGSITCGTPVSSWRMSWVLRATRAVASVGSPRASS